MSEMSESYQNNLAYEKCIIVSKVTLRKMQLFIIKHNLLLEGPGSIFDISM